MVEEKMWYQSKTIWGALMAVIAAALNTLGISIDAVAQAGFADGIIQLIGAVGAILAVYGRLSATEVIA